MEKEECCANPRRKIMPPYAHAYTTHPINKFTFVDPVWHSVEDDVSNPVSSNWVKAGAAHRRPEKHVKTLEKHMGTGCKQSSFCITCRICYSCRRRGIRFPSAPSASVPCTAAEGGDWSENSTIESTTGSLPDWVLKYGCYHFVLYLGGSHGLLVRCLVV